MFQFARPTRLGLDLGINYWIGVDGVSVFLVALTTLIFAVAILAATFMIALRLKLFLVFMLFLETAILGVFMSHQSLPVLRLLGSDAHSQYFLLGIWGEEQRVYATMKFLVYTIFGSFLMLVGIFYLWAQTGTLDMVGPHGLDRPPGEQQRPELALSGVRHRVRHQAADLAVSYLGAHGVRRVADAVRHRPVRHPVQGRRVRLHSLLSAALSRRRRALRGLISILAIIGMLYAAVLALVQTDIKRLVAYSSVSHMNLIALGIFALNPTATRRLGAADDQPQRHHHRASSWPWHSSLRAPEPASSPNWAASGAGALAHVAILRLHSGRAGSARHRLVSPVNS